MDAHLVLLAFTIGVKTVCICAPPVFACSK
jgi:hypothetical protein